MNWIFSVIQRIVPSFLNVIQRIESFLLNVTQRIESLLKNMKNSLIWSKERIEILWYDTKDWIFLIWLTEPNTFNITQRIELFSPIDSKKWTFFSNWLKEVNFFIWQNRTQRFDFFWYDSKNRTLFWMWLKELNTLHKRTPRIDFLFFSHFFTDLNPFQTRLTELSPFWTIWLIEIEPFFSTWVKENDSFKEWLKDFLLFLQNVWLKEWIELIVLGKYDSEIWNLKEKRTLRIEPFQKLTRSIEPSVLHDPKNWTFFSYITQRIGLSSF